MSTAGARMRGVPERRPAIAPARGGERGWALIEVVVAAAILIIVVLGVLAAVDSTAGTAAMNRARTVGAGLAEEDLERMRDMRTVDLSGYDETRTITASGVDYQVVSRAEWVRDESGTTESCSTKSTQASYLRLTSTVAPANGSSAVRPVSVSGLLAPPVGFGAGQGTLTVQVDGASGDPVRNLPVRISGPAARSELTNDAGCAVFAFVPAGTYQIVIATPGWVDTSGTTAVTGAGTVTTGHVSLSSFAYDRAALADVQVQTKIGAAAPVADPSAGVTAANPGVPPSGMRTFVPSAPTPDLQLGTLFPFTDGYTLYSGTCAGADPSRYVGGYFESNPGRIALDPGGAGGPVVLREPALNVRVRRGGADWAHAPDWNAPQAILHAYPVSPGCESVPAFESRLAGDGQDGYLPNPGLPFGRYLVCVDDPSDRHVQTYVDDIDPAGTPPIQLFLRTSGPRNGACADPAP